MSDKPRRHFLKQSAGLVSGLAAASCVPPEGAPVSTRAGLNRTTLDAVGRIVLPSETLGEERVSGVLDGFVKWLAELEPVAERDHPYLWTDEIQYGPPDPAPLWTSQLEALDIEAEKRHGKSFDELESDAQEALLTRHLPQEVPPELPYAGAAPHVAIGLLAYFYNTTEAHDLGYDAAIERQTCRGLDTAADEPKPLRS